MHDYDINKEKVELIARQILPNHVGQSSLLRVEPIQYPRGIKIYYEAKGDTRSIDINLLNLRGSLPPVLFDNFAANSIMRDKILASERLVAVMTGKV